MTSSRDASFRLLIRPPIHSLHCPTQTPYQILVSRIWKAFWSTRIFVRAHLCSSVFGGFRGFRGQKREGTYTCRRPCTYQSVRYIYVSTCSFVFGHGSCTWQSIAYFKPAASLAVLRSEWLQLPNRISTIFSVGSTKPIRMTPHTRTRSKSRLPVSQI